MTQLPKALETFVRDTQATTAAAKKGCSIAELKARAKDAPPLLSFAEALASDFGLIAEIKQQSPSMGKMNPENVAKAPELYRQSPVVKAISVLTNQTYFGADMSLERLRQVKLKTQKPVLRKDFITDEYEIWQARAYGADAILLMANILDEHELARLHGCAREIGLDVLFETHTREEIAKIPKDARIYGINCRSFASSETSFALSRWLGNWFGSRRDLTIDYARFDQCKDLPAHVLKVAESGVNPERIPAVRAAGYHAALVGTSLLIGPEPIEQVLRGFEEAILGMARKPAPATA